MMKLDEQRRWYEGWHEAGSHTLPVELLKQQMRLEAIDDSLQLVDYERVLVIGCGQGDELRLLQSDAVTAFDLSFNAAQDARKLFPDYEYLQADGMMLPFSDKCFDLVFSSEVLEHILEPERMLSEVRRVLRPGGILLLTTPNWTSFFGLARWLGEKILRRPITSDGQPVDHWSTPRSLQDLLKESGFELLHLRGVWYFPPTGWGMKRLPDGAMASVFRALLPLERRLQNRVQGSGHLLVALARLTP